MLDHQIYIEAHGGRGFSSRPLAMTQTAIDIQALQNEVARETDKTVIKTAGAVAIVAAASFIPEHNSMAAGFKDQATNDVGIFNGAVDYVTSHAKVIIPTVAVFDGIVDTLFTPVDVSDESERGTRVVQRLLNVGTKAIAETGEMLVALFAANWVADNIHGLWSRLISEAIVEISAGYALLPDVWAGPVNEGFAQIADLGADGVAKAAKGSSYVLKEWSKRAAKKI